MIDHMGVTVSDYAHARAFYERVLGVLDYEIVMDVTKEQTGGYEGCGFGPTGKPAFWIGTGATATTGVHVAFVAATRKAVDEFHAIALQHGARDNGAPGLRPHYHPNYYGAYVIDFDGNNLEAVCHSPE
ncbi:MULTISPECIES: VOC family protein [unclassified Lysobacter]|uniref:VOC family protein n=1 Tax=unclassified Lysobacter TaxID=2635362 RepID=UPI001C22A955|nr:VOC family protein [Lysobacter sp. MMG2]MBU8976114.1 VOC family protein [Lysobacter sp. MMG2]